MKPLRLLIAGHSLVNLQNRARLAALAGEPGLEVAALVPHRWTGSYGEEYAPVAGAEGGYRVIPHRVLFRGHNRMQLYVYGPGLGARIDEEAPDLLHVDEEPYSMAAFQLARASARRRIPIVLTSLQSVHKRFPVPFRWMERWVLSLARAAFTSPFSERVLRAKGFDRPLARVVMGVDPELYRPSADGALRASLGVEGLVAGYIGRLEPVKGVDVFIQALARAPGVTALIVGSGWQRAALEELARASGVADRLRWVPAVPHAEVPRWLCTMDVVVVPSVTRPNIQEQFPRAPMEAMACGIPVIGSSSGGIPEVVGDCGLVFPEGDAAQLAACLERMSDPALRARLGEAGRARCLERFTWTAMARVAARLYREAVS